MNSNLFARLLQDVDPQSRKFIKKQTRIGPISKCWPLMNLNDQERKEQTYEETGELENKTGMFPIIAASTAADEKGVLCNGTVLAEEKYSRAVAIDESQISAGKGKKARNEINPASMRGNTANLTGANHRITVINRCVDLPYFIFLGDTVTVSRQCLSSCTLLVSFIFSG